LEFMGDIPFRTVYIHGTVRDDTGRKMSKSLGNSIDPLSIIKDFSADALRFSLVMVTAVGQDVHLAKEKFELGRNFLTKLWNAARFMQMHTKDTPVHFKSLTFKPELLTPDDKHILARLHDAIAACTENLERCRFNDLAKTLYEFVWHQFCDWYIEYAKIGLNAEDPARRTQTLQVMHYVFANALTLLHPIIPFITEELWHAMGYGAEKDSIMAGPWPKAFDLDELGKWGIDSRTVEYVENKHDLIRVGRTLRADYDISPAMKIRYVIRPENTGMAELLRADEASIAFLLRAESLTVDPDFHPVRMINGISKLGAIFIPIEGLIDVQAEVQRLNGQLAKASGDLTFVSRKLESVEFVQRAPPEVVEQQRLRKQELQDKCEKLCRLIAVLSGDDK